MSNEYKIVYCLICVEAAETSRADRLPNFCPDCGNLAPFTNLEPGTSEFNTARDFYCKSLDSQRIVA